MKAYKQKVASNVGASYAKRFSNHFWTYRKGQLTTSNVKSMRDSSLGATSLGGSKNSVSNGTGEDDGSNFGETPVHSDLQPHALHTFSNDTHPSIVIAVPKTSPHVQNAKECKRASLMVGHTDPQVFHWFKQLGILPPRSIASGKIDVLEGAEKSEVWEKTFMRHPAVHDLAERLWNEDQTKTAAEVEAIEQRIRDEDMARMKRLSSSDWRSKHEDRTRSPTPAEDEAAPVYVLKEDTFSLLKITPEVKLWATMNSNMNRVYEPHFEPMQNLSRAHFRFLKILNQNRNQLIPSLNINYNLKLTNGFVFEIDDTGMYLMGTEENFEGSKGNGGKESWYEYRCDYGKDGMTHKHEGDMEWWIRGLNRMGAPEQGTIKHDDVDTVEQADTKFRHL